jgi:hypothetical protein
MHRNRSAVVFSATVLASVLAMAGCASAALETSVTQSAAVSGTSVASTARTMASAGSANIMVYSINSDGAYLRAVVTGAVGDYGPAVTVYPDGKVDPKHNSEIELKLTRGSFRLSIAGIDKKFVKATSHEPIYPRTCSDFINFTAAAPIVAGSGTGSYRGISGSFHLTVTDDEINPKPCQPVTAFLWQVIVLAGSGTVSF